MASSISARVEVGRGFYGLGFESGKKTADIILNPDEPCSASSSRMDA